MKIYRIAARPFNVDWSEVDWNKPNRDLVEELGVSRGAIKHQRRKRAPETIRKNTDWSQVDWSKSTTDIAKEMGKSVGAVSSQRKKHAPETIRQFRDIDWTKVDWGRDTSDLAEEFSVSSTAVSNQRKKHAPETMQKDIDWSKVDWQKPTIDIAKELGGIDASYVSERRWEYAPETTGKYRTVSKIDWSKVDWRKPTTDISKELQVSDSLVSTQRRRLAPETLKVVKQQVHNWAQVDWSKSNQEIVRDLVDDMIEKFDIDKQLFTNKYLYSLKSYVKHRRMSDAPWSIDRHLDWEDIDWGKTDLEIAMDTDTDRPHVWDMRRKYAPETMSSYVPSQESSQEILEEAATRNWYKRSLLF